MRLASLVLIVAAVGCGGKSKPTQLAPLPPDNPVAEPKPEVKGPAAVAEPAPPTRPPPPKEPLEITIPAKQVSVKLVGKGKGKLAPLRYTAKAGGKQQIELAMDFSATQTEGTNSGVEIIPTIVLTGEAETRTVDPAGTATYAFTISATDARDVQGAKVTAAKFRIVLASLVGLAITGSVDATGQTGEVKLRVAQPDGLSEGALELIRLTLPSWPVLPKEPIGLGAKWQATTTSQLADKLVVTQVTDYELVSHQGTKWSIKGTTKVSGSDQEVDGGKISAISGTGTTDITLADGALYPTHATVVETRFTASEPDKSIAFVIKVGGAVTAK
jgi:hypothetical protein